MKDSRLKYNQTARLIVQLVRDFGLSVTQAAAIAMVSIETVERVLIHQPNFGY